MSDIWDDMSAGQLRETCRDIYRELQVLLSRKTLEDEFAMAALNGLLANPETQLLYDEDIARRAVLQARACMAERSKK